MEESRISQVSDLLKRYGLFEQMTDEQRKILTTVPHSLGYAVYYLAPSARCTGFLPDVARDIQDFRDILNELARATLGEWFPQNITVVQEQEDVVLAFDWRGQRFHWQWRQDSKYVLPGFMEAVNDFAATHLTGVYVDPLGDGDTFVYLPYAVAQVIEELLNAS